MNTLILAEWYKILHSKTLGLILIGVAALTSLEILSSYLMQETHVLGQNSIIKLGEGMSMHALWIAAFAGFFIASEFQNGTIRNVIALGKDRTHILLSKIFSACIAVVAILAINGIVAIIGLTAAFGFGDMTIGEFSRLSVWSFFMQVIYHSTYAAVFTMLAFLSKNSGMTILLCVVYEIATLAIGGFLNNFPGDSLSFALQFFPQYYASEIDDFGFNLTFIVNGIIISVVYLVASSMIGSVAFKKSDIK